MNSEKTKSIRSLQKMLHAIAKTADNSADVLPSGYYGEETKHAVSSFQKSHALPDTGIADQQTWDLIVRQYDSVNAESENAWPIQVSIANGSSFHSGDTHTCVRLIQCMLCCIGSIYHVLTSPEINGIYDDATSEAVSSFQMLCCLPVTGTVDKHTWKHLAIHYAATALKDTK